MGIVVEDLIGLNQTRVADIPIVPGQATAANLLQRAMQSNGQLSVMGMHHCQGGHAMLEGASLLLTETMNKVSVNRQSKTVTASAGATWTEVHAAANREALTPCVQQSSAHFTVGGSLSVNCHGRDPRFGPVSETVLSMKVLCGDGQIRFTDRANFPDLFRAVLGGYGGCGMILEATLQLTDNQMLSPSTHIYRSVDKYQAYLESLIDKTDVHIHYAWLRCTQDKFLEHVLSVNAILDPGVNEPFTDAVLEDEGWGTSEVLRAGWDLSRTHEECKKLIWRELEATRGSGNNKSRLNWMRTSVSFTASRGDAHGVDILQEYFVPVHRLTEMVAQLKTIFTQAPTVNVLSSTLRLVRPDDLTNLSYCKQGHYASIAIDAHIGVHTDANGQRAPDAAAQAWITQATEAAFALGGTYYLPYYKVADAAQFARAYSAPGIAAQRDAILEYNPNRKFWNGFLEKYFA